MLLEKITVGSYATNCYIMADEETKEAIVIDPGSEPERILSKLTKHDLKAKYIVLTHAHGDHIGAIAEIKKETGAKILLHHDEAYMLEDSSKNFSKSIHGKPVSVKADETIGEGDRLNVGKLKVEVIHTPGHTFGGICLYVASEKILITGDTLFYGSVGRSDLEGGNHKQLIQGIIDKIMKLDDSVTVYPGHGATTSIGFERRKNPFIQG